MTDDTPDDPAPNDDRVDPDVPSDDGGEGGKVLSPEELDIAESEYVEEIDEGRYVVSAGGGPPNVPDSGREHEENSRRPRSDEERGERDREQRSEQAPDRNRRERPHPPAATGGPRSPEAARTLLAEELERSNARYGLDIVGRFGGDTVRHRTASDDVIATFEGLVRWYAGHVTDGTPTEEVIEILLRESSFTTDETPNLARLLDSHDLDRTDSIADLVAAIREESRE